MHAALQPQSAGGEPGMPGGAGAVAVLHRCEPSMTPVVVGRPVATQ